MGKLEVIFKIRLAYPVLLMGSAEPPAVVQFAGTRTNPEFYFIRAEERTWGQFKMTETRTTVNGSRMTQGGTVVKLYRNLIFFELLWSLGLLLTRCRLTGKRHGHRKTSNQRKR